MCTHWNGAVSRTPQDKYREPPVGPQQPDTKTSPPRQVAAYCRLSSPQGSSVNYWVSRARTAHLWTQPYPFGLRSFSQPSLMHWLGCCMLAWQLHYLDDFLVMGPPSGSTSYARVLEVTMDSRQLGVPVATHLAFWGFRSTHRR